MDKTDYNRIEELLPRYCEGLATEEERLQVETWMDGIVFKVRDNGKIINKTVYLCVGLKQNGLKEVLGMWVGKSESSSFWMGILHPTGF